MLGFDEFCDYIKDNIRAYMSETFQKNNFDFLLGEAKDSYDMVNSLISLHDKRNPDAVVPVFHLDAAYENYLQSGDLEGIVVMLASKYEAAYKDNIDNNKEKLRPEFEVLAGDGGVSNAFVISRDSNEVNLYQDEILIELSTQEKSNLLLLEINGNVVLAVPVKGRKDYWECMECIDLVKKEDPEQLFSKEPKLYDRENNLIVSTTEEIDTVLQRMEEVQRTAKRSVFSRG